MVSIYKLLSCRCIDYHLSEMNKRIISRKNQFFNLLRRHFLKFFEIYCILYSKLTAGKSFKRSHSSTAAKGDTYVLTNSSNICPLRTLHSKDYRIILKVNLINIKSIDVNLSGLNVHFLTRTRMDKAQELLSQPGVRPLQEISQACGYPNKSYFCQVFKKYTGLTPGEFEQQCAAHRDTVG